jgi:DnaJ-class molecular chaperone
MLKILLILIAICVLWRWAFGQWPWEALSTRSTRQQSLFKARKLLELEDGASADEIKAAHKRRIAKVHPDRGGSNAQVHEANAARDLLLAQLPERSDGDGGRINADDNSEDGGGGSDGGSD